MMQTAKKDAKDWYGHHMIQLCSPSLTTFIMLTAFSSQLFNGPPYDAITIQTSVSIASAYCISRHWPHRSAYLVSQTGCAFAQQLVLTAVTSLACRSHPAAASRYAATARPSRWPDH
eukprot:TRINITY_DN2082_c0_g1_i3.p1 TRINITY_DN2082_c0_g1~~TRINITY_DN2082_c0_g1_i3.p1  ORF type:complete len:117 (+),score=18.91 TRINITY_DN2082_c0_g1_i3:539-889(+)